MIKKTEKQLQVWETIDRKLVKNMHPWLSLWIETVRLPNGRIVKDYHVIEQLDYAVAVGVTNNREVLAIWHYKHGARRVNLGLPAGYVKSGEQPQQAAQRELLEETGYKAESWSHLGSFVVDGNRGCGKAHFYLARKLCYVSEPTWDDLEEMRIEFMNPSKLRQSLANGEVATLGAATAIALTLNTLGADNTV